MDKKELVVVRAYNPSDRNFILATWLRGLYYGDNFWREVPKDIFMERYHTLVEHAIDDSKTVIQVACLKEDPEVILGYAVLGANTTGITLHWCFVKSAWRSIGIAKGLVPKEHINAVTHLTKTGLSILRKNPDVIFNPFLF